MSATTTQTIHIISCPACGNPIELHATYDVRLDLDADASAFDRTVTATLMMTGARVNHECPPPKLLRDKGIGSPALVIPSTRED